MRPLSPLRRQLAQVSRERNRRIQDFRVARVLAILRDDNLASHIALELGSRGCLTFECNFVDEVWSDPRIVYRVAQLRERGLIVEPVVHEQEIAGQRFTRSQIQVQI